LIAILALAAVAFATPAWAANKEPGTITSHGEAGTEKTWKIPDENWPAMRVCRCEKLRAYAKLRWGI
jgi:hypothetical protein